MFGAVGEYDTVMAAHLSFIHAYFVCLYILTNVLLGEQTLNFNERSYFTNVLYILK